MEKPAPKREIAIDFIISSANVISVWATNDALSDLRDFGELIPGGKASDNWWLQVDPRYDLDEVKAYIENYGQD